MSAFLKVSGGTLDESEFPSLLSFLRPALPDTPAGLYLHGSGLGDDVLLSNWANPALPLTKIGSPNAGGLGFTASYANGFETGIAETEEMTFINVCKPLVAGSALMISAGAAANPNTPRLTQMFWVEAGGSSTLRMSSRTGENANVTVTHSGSNGAGNVNDWNVAIGAVNSSSMSIGWGRDGTYDEYFTTSLVGRAVSGSTCRIGGWVSQTYGANVQIALSAIYTRMLSAAERAAVAESLRAYFAQAGIDTL